MADNILKNEFMWQEQQKKKKLYKNWKLYAVALGIITVGLGVGLGVGLNIHHNETTNPITSIDLGNLELNTILENPITNQEDAFNAFINNNKEKYSDLENNIEISSFTAPNYISEGKLIVKAKTNTIKYTGTITVSINAIGQTNLTDLKLNTTLENPITNQDDAFKAFIDLNSTITDLASNVAAGTFTTPNYTSEGKLIVNATTDGKYTGSVEINIPKLVQTALSTLNTTAIDGIENMIEDDAFKAFLVNNNNITDLKNNVELSFDAPKYISTGSLTITAKPNTKYSGQITIIINAIGQISLTELELNTTLENPITNQDDAFKAFIDLNSTITDLASNVAAGTFTTPNYNSEGKLIVNATTAGKYTGSVEINIPKLVDEQHQIVDAINQTSYSIQPTRDSLASSVTGQINSEFIQNQLTDEINKVFNANLFTFNKITINNINLKNSDLTTVGTINAKINYNYDSIQNQETNLTINVQERPEQKIIDAIKIIPYQIEIPHGTSYQALFNKINVDFITKPLPDEIKKIFDPNLFTIYELVKDGKTINNAMLQSAGTIINNVDINYAYNKYSGYDGDRTFLTIIIT